MFTQYKNIGMVLLPTVSDPPGISLYYTVGVDCKVGGIPVWRCCQGTNFVEGGVHHSIHDYFPP